MAKLSITTAWNETMDFVKRDAGALFTIAFALVALPSVALQALGPGQVSPGETPELGLWLLLVPVVLFLSIAGTLAISALAIGRENVVGSAIALGFRRFLPMLGAALLVGLGALLVMIPLFVLLGLGGGDLSQPSPEVGARFGIAMLVLAVLFIFIWVRLTMMTPVAVAEPLGPIGIIRRSWQLTAGHFWKLLGFFLLFIIMISVVLLAVTAVFGILVVVLAGQPDPGTLSALLILLIGGLVNAVAVVFLTVMFARIYVQLAGGETTGS